MNINYTKMHGLKNDFIIIDSRIEKVSLNTKIIKKIADRKKGIGCDQVVILQKPKKKSASAFINFIILTEVILKHAVMLQDVLHFF